MAFPINPRRLFGPWNEGFALGVHTVASQPAGLNEYGHTVWDTVRSPLGEALYRVKYQGDQSSIPEIAATVEAFLENWRIHIDLIVPAPPSKQRRIQPVALMADQIGAHMDIAVCADCVFKTRSTTQLKNVGEPEQRAQLLSGAFGSRTERVSGRQLLLFDDLFRSGGTLEEISNTLRQSGASAVFVLALTYTRTKL